MSKSLFRPPASRQAARRHTIDHMCHGWVHRWRVAQPIGASGNSDLRDRHRDNHLADLLHAADRSDEAMAHLKQAVTIFAEIGVEASTLQPEIWKLSEWRGQSLRHSRLI